MKYLMYLLVFTAIPFFSFAQRSNAPINISGQADFLKNGDTVLLRLYKYGVINNETSYQTTTITSAKNQNFSFVIPSGKFPQYVNITFNGHGQKNLLEYLVESGDQIHLIFNKNQLKITGAKSTGFEIQHKIKVMEDNFMRAGKYPHLPGATFDRLCFTLDSLMKVKDWMIAHVKNQLSKPMLELLETGTSSAAALEEYSDLLYSGSVYQDSSSNPIVEMYRNHLNKYGEPKVTTNSLSAHCNDYIQYLFHKYEVDSCLMLSRPFDIVNCLSYFYSHDSGQLREQLIGYIISENYQYPAALKSSINQILPVIRNPDYREIMKQIEAKRIDGDQAYKFSLMNANGEAVGLGDFAGQVVVLDFWFTGCENCQELAPHMKKLEQDFKGLPVKFITVSTDKDKRQWLKSVDGGTYTSGMSVNLYTSGEGVRHPVIKNYHILDYPTLVLINQKGEVFNVPVDPRSDDGKELKKQIADCLH